MMIIMMQGNGYDAREHGCLLPWGGISVRGEVRGLACCVPEDDVPVCWLEDVEDDVEAVSDEKREASLADTTMHLEIRSGRM